MEYTDYGVEDFVLDKKFRRWILEENNSLDDFWADWIEKHPHKLEMLKEARKIVLNIPEVRYNIPESQIREIWENVEKAIDKNQSGTKEGKLVPLKSSSILLSDSHSGVRKNKLSVYWRVAAVFIFALCVSYYTLKLTNRKSGTDRHVTHERIEKSTVWGQKMRFFLSDGSEVILNSGSILRYSKYFEHDKRELELTGEAYFKVAHDAERPFTVKTSNLQTTALGTEFNINAYDPLSSSVVLAKGKVEVLVLKSNEYANERFVLLPGEGVKYKGAKNLSRFNFDTKEFLYWKDGVLYFQNAGEEQVYKKLENWYGVQIITENSSSKKWGFNGEFHNKSLEIVMMSLSFAMDFTFQIENDSVKIKYN